MDQFLIMSKVYSATPLSGNKKALGACHSPIGYELLETVPSRSLLRFDFGEGGDSHQLDEGLWARSADGRQWLNLDSALFDGLYTRQQGDGCFIVTKCAMIPEIAPEHTHEMVCLVGESIRLLTVVGSYDVLTMRQVKPGIETPFALRATFTDTKIPSSVSLAFEGPRTIAVVEHEVYSRPPRRY